MVHSIITIDTHRSKMGEDRDVCVLSFMVKDRNPAKDLMEFIEKGYDFVLDSDVSSGENDKGEYYVFVELTRSPKLAEEIAEIEYGLKKLTGVDNFKFRYHKSNALHDLTEDSIKSIIPSTSQAYEGFVNRVKTEGVKKFFSKTLMDDLTLDGNVITIHKPFNKKVKLKWVDETDQPVIEGAVLVDDKSTSEVFWLTKILGDYNINKIGENFIFTNGNRSMLLQRIEE